VQGSSTPAGLSDVRVDKGLRVWVGESVVDDLLTNCIEESPVRINRHEFDAGLCRGIGGAAGAELQVPLRSFDGVQKPVGGLAAAEPWFAEDFYPGESPFGQKFIVLKVSHVPPKGSVQLSTRR
jgi:hypothetical protein